MRSPLISLIACLNSVLIEGKETGSTQQTDCFSGLASPGHLLADPIAGGIVSVGQHLRFFFAIGAAKSWGKVVSENRRLSINLTLISVGFLPDANTI